MRKKYHQKVYILFLMELQCEGIQENEQIWGET